MIAAMGTQPLAVILDDSAQDELDLTTAQVVAGLLKELHEKGIKVLFAGVHASMLEGAHDGRRAGCARGLTGFNDRYRGESM